ncbi:MAG: HAD-IA family hydrolase [Reyranella sp.]|nr:HAD-IA family hydrolase [Reyranella sp.]MBL6652329.1 HAD-IA family hydrolase [Reyranella sp.]
MADILILDAMGVLYQSGDDVADLLVPFVGKHGRADLSAEAIDLDYIEASLGKLDADAFWRRMGVDPALEDSYLAGHRLIDGTLDALAQLKQRHGRLACLSNDVSSWSFKLRRRFGLESWIDHWFISGDLGLRKPSAEIYRLAADRLGVRPQQVVFVDDRPGNLDAAKAVGFNTVLLDIRGNMPEHPHRRIRQLKELI